MTRSDLSSEIGPAAVIPSEARNLARLLRQPRFLVDRLLGMTGGCPQSPVRKTEAVKWYQEQSWL